MEVRELAYNFILENRINNLNIDLKLLKDICKINKWKIGSYSKNINFLETTNLIDKITLLAFNCFYKNDNKEKVFIMYNDKVEEDEIVFNILHEIGHIVLKHNICDLSNFEKEREADLFACEVLAPSCLLKYLNLNKIDAITNISNIPPKYIKNYIDTYKNYKLYDDYFSKIIIKTFKHLKEYRLLKFFKYKKIFITLFFLITFFININYTNSYSKNIPDIDNNIFDINNIPVINNNIKDTNHNYQSFFVTKTGKKYHKEDCKYIIHKDNLIEIKSNDPILNNYKPCSICID